MKAVICTKYGPPDVLKLQDVPQPIPRANQVRVRIKATAVTASDIFVRGSNLPLRTRIAMRIAIGLRRPRKGIIGMIFAGDVDAVGPNVARFEVGDTVYGFTGIGLGTYAEFTCIKETGCIGRMPATLDYEEAAAIAYGGLLGLHCVDRGDIQPGQKVLVYGASGAIGTFAVQLAKHYGAEVTGVCSTRNLDLVRSLGADHVLDYTQQESLPDGMQYDFVLDAVGRAKSSTLKEACERAVAPGGKSISIDDGSPQLNQETLHKLTRVIDGGHFQVVIDRTYPLEDIVEAHRYVEKGHKRGNVVITIV